MVEVRVGDQHAVYRLPGVQPVKPINIWKRSYREQARDVEGCIVWLLEEVGLMAEGFTEVEEDRAFARLQQYLGAPDLAEATIEGQFD